MHRLGSITPQHDQHPAATLHNHPTSTSPASSPTPPYDCAVMSFFGFETSLPRDRSHPSNAPGFGEAPDHFAGLSRNDAALDDDGSVISLRCHLELC